MPKLMLPRLSSKILLALAGVLSLVTASLIYIYLKDAAQPVAAVARKSVVVASQDIGAHTMVTAEMVKSVDLPTEAVQQDVLSDLSQVVGAMTRIPVTVGDQMTDKRIVTDRRMAGMIGAIPRNKRAFTVAVNEISGVGGFVKPGDYVDLIITTQKGEDDLVGKVFMQGIQVLATNRKMEGMSEGDKSDKVDQATSNVTLAVTSAETVKLALASEQGKIHLSLRPIEPYAGVTLMGNYSMKDVVGYEAWKDKVQPVVAPSPAARPQMTPATYGTAPPQQQSERSITVLRGSKSETISVD